MLHQNVISQIKRIQLSCFLPLNIISLAVLSLILFLTNINIYAAQVDLAWSPNSESDLAGYKVYYGNTSVSYDSNIDVGNQTSYTIQNLAEGQTYYIAVTAYDTVNNESSYSSEVVYNVPDTTLPLTPTNLQSTVVSTSQVDLTWNASSDNIGVTGYRIYRDSTQIATTSNTTFQDTGLSPSTTYSYTVSAYDAAGNESGQSSASSATTLSLPVNNPPVLSPVGNKFVNEGQALSFTISATDIDGDTLNYTAGSLPTGAIFNESTRTLSWTPTYNQTGTYSNITFQVSDGNDIDSESITITVNNVNRAPVLNPITDFTVDEGATITLSPTATDPDGDTLTYTYTGWMFISSYTTNYTDAGTHTVTVTVSDGALTDSQDVTVTVDDINRPPVLNLISDITVTEGAAITISPAATDPDGNTLTFSYSGWMTSASYTTNYNDSGTHTVTVTVSDDILTDSQDVTITVTDVNVAPILNTITDITVNEGDTVTLNPTASDQDGDALTYTYSGWMTSNSYITNYNDSGTHTVTVTVSDGDLTDSQDVTITITDIDTTPPNSSISINNGAESVNATSVTLSLSSTDNVGVTDYYLSIISSTPLASNPDWVSVTPIVNFNADVPYALTSGDGTKTVYVWYKDAAGNVSNAYSDSITLITNLNVAPVLDPIADITVNEGDAVILSPTATDPDGDTLTYTYTGWMTSNSYTTNYNDSGTHTVTVTVSDDSLSDSQVVTITVGNTNRPPVLNSVSDITVNEGATINLSPTATDLDGDTLTYTYSGWMSSSSYTTNYADAGTHTVTVTVSDGTLTDSQNLTVTVGDINRAPVLDLISDITVGEGAIITLSPTATDPDGDTLTYTYTGWMSSGNYTTNYTDAGTHTVTVTVSDGILTDSQDVTITVTDVNVAPILNTIADITVNEGDTVTLNPAASDQDGDALTYTYTGWMILSIYTTNYNDSGTHTVTVTVSDGSLSDSQVVTITVGDINRPPVLDPVSDMTVNEGDTVTLNPTATDPDGDALTYTYSDWMSSASYTTSNDDAGTYTVTVTVSDGTLTDSQDVTITVSDIDNIQPSTPANLQATVFANTKMNLSWNASTDNVGVTGYRLYRDGIQVADSSSTTYQDTGLSKNTTYAYTISAYDAAGNESSQSTPLVSNTKPPGRPTGMKIAGT